jgi:hypothetical protein
LTERYEGHLRETVDGAAGVLMGVFGRPLELQVEHNFRRPDYRAIVLRCRVAVAEGRQQIPDTVIVKRFRGDHGEPYDAEGAHETGARERLLNEWAGVRFLQSVGGERPFGPALYGCDGRLGLAVSTARALGRRGRDAAV